MAVLLDILCPPEGVPTAFLEFAGAIITYLVGKCSSWEGRKEEWRDGDKGRNRGGRKKRKFYPG